MPRSPKNLKCWILLRVFLIFLLNKLICIIKINIICIGCSKEYKRQMAGPIITYRAECLAFQQDLLMKKAAKSTDKSAILETLNAFTIKELTYAKAMRYVSFYVGWQDMGYLDYYTSKPYLGS